MAAECSELQNSASGTQGVPALDGWQVEAEGGSSSNIGGIGTGWETAEGSVEGPA